MKKIERIVHFKIPMSICNFRCHYCYLAQREKCYQNIQPEFKYSPEQVGNAFKKEHIGGLAYVNFCADGETLLTKDIDLYIKAILEKGHYAEVITNLTVSSMIDKILLWDPEILKRIEFKASFHYLELKEKKLLETFSDNVKKIWKTGASCSIEITPSDELIPFIDEIMQYALENFGALPHITIARDDRTPQIDYLTKLSMEDYNSIWSQFNSSFWQFKKSIFGIKRREFCYAGLWSLYINLATGYTKPCYCGKKMDNFFENVDKPYHFKPIGCCLLPHCYNGHMLMTLGLIPDLTDVKYGDIRDRVTEDGRHWLQKDLHDVLNSKCSQSNAKIGIAMQVGYWTSTWLHYKKDKLLSNAKMRMKKLISHK